ncbi:SPK domain-containing protein [Caenorhabditis elegans]|uniref:SPK domain-containing protein n=1 Tax=Caenorhabditis elegans TaxID=6239 RepID=Q9XU06_CAEEL|nr:SPK domain-containing protein [Caenorhabditis elegans]CAB07287.1 SPK domain-containing protein [Caenorhabditis elegans]|eukprot:NP_499795.1 Uncharacterized protein CELE_T28A8.3 [Caenorhabditis elegans]
MVFTDTQLERLMSFLVEQTKDSIEPLVVLKVFTEYSNRENDGLSYRFYYDRFRTSVALNMAKLTEYTIEDRIRVMFGFAGEVSDDFLTKIETIGIVKLDEKKRICKFTSHDGKLKLEAVHSHSARMKRMCFLQVKGSADLVRFMDFLVEKTKDTIVPVAACKVLTEYSKRENDGLSYSVYYRRFRRSVAPNMAKFENYSIEERVRIMFGFAGKVADDFLEQIKTEGVVELDDGKRICKYASHDGKLKLEGDHSRSARNKRKYAAYRKTDHHHLSNAKDPKLSRKSGRKSDLEFSDKSDEDDVDSAISKCNFPKRARCEKSADPELHESGESDDDEEMEDVGGIDGDPDLEPIDVEHDKIADRDVADNSSIDDIHENMPARVSESDDDEYIGAVNEDPEHRLFDESHIDYLQSDEEMILEDTDDDVDYAGMVEAQPKPEPIDFHFDQINNRDNFQGNQEMMIENNNRTPFLKRQQIDLSADNRATSAESKTILMHDFLKQLTQFICFLESPKLAEIKQQIKESIGTGEDEKLQVTDIHTVLEAFFFGVSRKIRLDASNNPAMKVKDFTLKFKFFILALDFSELLELKKKVQGIIDEPEFNEKILPISDIRRSLQNLLFTISQ